jgi:hypothetical protein
MTVITGEAGIPVHPAPAESRRITRSALQARDANREKVENWRRRFVHDQLDVSADELRTAQLRLEKRLDTVDRVIARWQDHRARIQAKADAARDRFEAAAAADDDAFTPRGVNAS